MSLTCSFHFLDVHQNAKKQQDSFLRISSNPRENFNLQPLFMINEITDIFFFLLTWDLGNLGCILLMSLLSVHNDFSHVQGPQWALLWATGLRRIDNF